MSSTYNEAAYPVEPKVKAATFGSGLASLLLFGALSIVQDERVPLLIGFLPEWLEPFALALVPAAITAVAGYYAKHQHRRAGVPVPPSEAE
jgi:hypothetical protein